MSELHSQPNTRRQPAPRGRPDAQAHEETARGPERAATATTSSGNDARGLRHGRAEPNTASDGDDDINRTADDGQATPLACRQRRKAAAVKAVARRTDESHCRCKGDRLRQTGQNFSRSSAGSGDRAADLIERATGSESGATPPAVPFPRWSAARWGRARRFTRSDLRSARPRVRCSFVRECPASFARSPLHGYDSNHHHQRLDQTRSDPPAPRRRRAGGEDPRHQPIVRVSTHLERAAHTRPHRQKRPLLDRPARTIRHRPHHRHGWRPVIDVSELAWLLAAARSSDREVANPEMRWAQ